MAEKITKKNWSSNFTLIGKPIIGDYTFKIDEHSSKSSWVYNSINLGIDCGEKFGTIYCELMGGFSEDRENVIYAHGKDDDGNDDFDNRIEVAWEDRLEESILSEIGDMCFITIGLEKTDKGKIAVEKFLSAYDAIAYIQEHLTSDMVVKVRGNLKYSMYNDNVQVRKEINSVVLSRVDDPANYIASFTQTILLDKDSASLKNIDKDKGVMYVDAIVLDYMKEYNGIEVKSQFPYRKQFEFEMPLNDGDKCKKIVDKVFKVKKGLTQITFDGVFVESGATVKVTVDDLTEDIKELIEFGIYTEEAALAKCASNGNKERRMIIQKPVIRMVGEDDNKVPVIQKFENAYEEDDLILDCMTAKANEDDDDDSFGETESEEDGSSGDDSMDWLNDL